MACQELRADNDELRRQNAELEAKDWGWIMMDPWGCHRMRFPLFPTGFHMPDDSQQHDITTIHAKKGKACQAVKPPPGCEPHTATQRASNRAGRAGWMT